MRATINAVPRLCAQGATVIWTRTRRVPDLSAQFRRWFAGAGFTEQAFHAPLGGRRGRCGRFGGRWASLRSWTEGDGTHVYLCDGYVAPPARQRGLGSRLLRESEAVAARLCADRTENGPVVLGGRASTVQPDRMTLLERSGYRQVFTMVEMEHDGSLTCMVTMKRLSC